MPKRPLSWEMFQADGFGTPKSKVFEWAHRVAALEAENSELDNEIVRVQTESVDLRLDRASLASENARLRSLLHTFFYTQDEKEYQRVELELIQEATKNDS